MNNASLEAIRDSLNPLYSWKPQSIKIDLEAFDESEARHCKQSINLVDIIGIGRQTQKNDDIHRFYLPRDIYNENTQEARHKLVAPYVSNACYQAGFSLRMRGWNKKLQCIYFTCSYGVCFSGQQSIARNQVSGSRKLCAGFALDCLTDDEVDAIAGLSTDKMHSINNQFQKEFHKRQKKTFRPLTPEETCKCLFPLYWEGSDDDVNVGQGTWFFARNGAGQLCHNGHMQKETLETRRLLSHVSNEAKNLAVAIHNVHLDSSIVNAVIRQNNNEVMDAGQIRYWCRQATIPPSVDASNNLSSAQRIINYLESQKDITFDYLTADERDAGRYVSIRKLRVTRTKVESQTRKQFTEEIPPGMLEHPTEDVDSAESWSKSVMRALTFEMNGSPRVLIGVVWVTDEQRRMANCFPEAVGMDVQFGTNQEKRNLLIMTVKTSENHINCILQYLMPSGARWSNNFVATKALPSLLGRCFCERLQAIATDGEQKLYGPFVEQMVEGGVLPNCKHFLCIWHLAYRSKDEPNINPRKFTRLQSIYHEIFRQLLMSLSSVPETRTEYNIMVQCIMRWLKSTPDVPLSPRHNDRLGVQGCDDLLSFLTKAVLEHQQKFAFYERRLVRSFDLRTTSNTESEGAAIKNNPMGPRPHDAINKMAKAVVELNRRRTERKSKAPARKSYKRKR
ncbi:hypothetical protein MPSEU_000333000 [Mayamaea pseudoterrestris]|nr:hypothetical protein MPSEU_000333000 [Mayamaea pseudoterrestris]